MALSDLFGSTTPTNDQIVDAQRKAALEAQRLAENQKLRRQGAQAEIAAIFDGGVYDPSQYLPYDWGAVDENLAGWNQAQTSAANAAIGSGATGGLPGLPPKPEAQFSEGGAVIAPDWMTEGILTEALNRGVDPWIVYNEQQGNYTLPAAPEDSGYVNPENYRPREGTAFGAGGFLKEIPNIARILSDPDSYTTGPGSSLVLKPDAWQYPENAPRKYTGIGNDFYDAYRQSIIDYYDPQLEDALRDAEGQTTLGFSSRGTRNSSAADVAFGDLKEDFDLQYGNMVSRADDQTGQLKQGIRAEKERLLGLAASAEDPTRFVNNALSEVNAVQTQKPDLTPLGDVFNSAALGYWAYEDEKNRQQFYNPTSKGSAPKSSGRVLGG